MADTEYQLVVLENLWMEFEVAVDRVIEFVTVRLGPAHEGQLPNFRTAISAVDQRKRDDLGGRRGRGTSTNCGRPSWCRRCTCW